MSRARSENCMACADTAGFASGQPQIMSTESVPFRLTPNMQRFITRTGVEGVMTGAVTAISKSLTTPGFDLGGTLHLFVRDEVSAAGLR